MGYRAAGLLAFLGRGAIPKQQASRPTRADIVQELKQQKFIRVLFDEFHSESWTISEARAIEMQPDRPGYSSYQHAADALATRGFTVKRNLDKPLTTIEADVDQFVREVAEAMK